MWPALWRRGGTQPSASIDPGTVGDAVRRGRIWERHAPVGLAFRNYPARDPQWDADRWWMHEPSRSLTLVELAKLGATVIGGG